VLGISGFQFFTRFSTPTSTVGNSADNPRVRNFENVLAKSAVPALELGQEKSFTGGHAND
jgi:hypothetical protein